MAFVTLQIILIPPHTKVATPCESKLARGLITASREVNPSKRGFRFTFEAKRLKWLSFSYFCSICNRSCSTLWREPFFRNVRSSSDRSLEFKTMIRALSQASDEEALGPAKPLSQSLPSVSQNSFHAMKRGHTKNTPRLVRLCPLYSHKCSYVFVCIWLL